MVKRPTWILLIILGLVIGGYFIIKNRPVTELEAMPTATPATLFQEATHGLLIKIQMTDPETGISIKLERNNNGIWEILSPESGMADQGMVEAAETQIFALGILTPLDVIPDLTIIGLSSPTYTVSLTFADSNVQTLLIGKKTPTSSGYYVQVEDKVYVIATESIDAILELLRNPPSLATETPTPTLPTETATLEVTSTPELISTTQTSTPVP